jgi:hypothetical protein
VSVVLEVVIFYVWYWGYFQLFCEGSVTFTCMVFVVLEVIVGYVIFYVRYWWYFQFFCVCYITYMYGVGCISSCCEGFVIFYDPFCCRNSTDLFLTTGRSFRFSHKRE